MARTIIVGDVHGCRRELEALLEACELASEDELVLVGDLVAKGPDSAGVVRLVRTLGAKAVRGNHDQHLLNWKLATEAGHRPAPRPEHERAARSLSAADWEHLASLPSYLRLPHRGAVVVHAGLMPGVAIEQQATDDLLRLRSIRADGSGSSKLDGRPWASLWQGPELVFFGHDARRGLQLHPHAIGLDTGCAYGRKLTAYLLPDRRLVSVPAQRRHCPVAAPAGSGSG